MLYAKIFIPSKVNITSMQTSSKLKVITVIFLITGFIFISVNFISPHTILVEKTVQVPHQISIPIESHIDSMHFSFLDRNYRYFPAVSANAGQTLKLTWYSDIEILVFIFSQPQFSNFQSIFPQLNGSIHLFPTPFPLQTSGFGRRASSLSYNVTDTGYYVAVITNANYDYPAYVQVSHFDEFVISYTYQTELVTETQNVPQNDNLYLYIGSFLVIAGVLIALVFYRINKKKIKF
jgi:hypothetical protein